MLDDLILTVLATWFLVTALVQLPSKPLKRIRKFDITGHLLPGWNFFSPKPIQADIEIMYRSWDFDTDDQGAAIWLDLVGAYDRRFWNGVFYPRRRGKKVMFQACDTMINYQRREASSRQELVLSVPYIIVLSKVASLAKFGNVVQFRIDARMRTKTTSAKTVLTSDVHWISAGSQSEVSAGM